MKIMEKVKAIKHIAVLNMKLIPLKCKLWFLLWKVRKNKNKKMDKLFSELLEDPYDVEKWFLLFDDQEFGQFLTQEKRVEVIRNLCKGPYSLEYLQIELPDVIDTVAMETAIIDAEEDFLDLDAALCECCVDDGGI